MYQQLEFRPGECAAWDSLGHAYYRLGDQARAADCYQTAIRLYRDLGSRPGQAGSLSRLGDAWLAADRRDAAREAWLSALEILDDLHHPDAEELRAKLQRLS